MISAFARAAQVLDEPRYLGAAQRSARFLREQLWHDGRLIRSYREGASKVAGFADDYASLIQGLLDLYEADFDVAWLHWAFELQAAMDRQFWDAEHGGYFSVGADVAGHPAADEGRLRRRRALAQLRRRAESAAPQPAQPIAPSCASKPSEPSATSPSSSPRPHRHAADALRRSMPPLAAPRQIVIAGPLADPETRALLREVHRHYLPDTSSCSPTAARARNGSAKSWSSSAPSRPSTATAPRSTAKTSSANSPSPPPRRCGGSSKRRYSARKAPQPPLG